MVVGRNAKQNDRVSFSAAQPHHIWLHAQGSPGAHCLLLLEPGEKGRLPSKAALQYGADVAALFSKAGKGSKSVPVTFAWASDVKRISGAAPGQVSLLRQEGVMYGSPDRGAELVERFRDLAA